MNNFNDACSLSCDDWLNNFSELFDYDFSKSFDKEMQKLIDKMRKDKYHKFTRKSMQVLIIAAIILSFATTVFAIPSSRKYIIQQFKDHFSYTVSDKDSNINDINEITIGYVPYGFKINYTDSSELETFKEYRNSNNWFTVNKDTINTEINFDSLEREIKVINGIEYLLFTTDSTNGVIWNNGLYTYTITGDISEEELIKIALEVE